MILMWEDNIVQNNSQPRGKSDVKSSTKLFFSGVFVLTISNLIIKAIGLLFKIPMNHIVGDTGMGYYSPYGVWYWIRTSESN